MKEKKVFFILCPLLLVYWLFPILGNGLYTDAETIKTLAAYVLFLLAAALCRFLQNRHAAMVSLLVIGAGICVLHPVALYDVLPALLPCGWMRCWEERGKGNAGTLYFELLTNLAYAYLIAAAVRLFRNGYSFVRIQSADEDTVPALFLMAIVLLFFAVCFFRNVGHGEFPKSPSPRKKKNGRGEERRFVGLIPVPIAPRTFWGLCVLLSAACLLQYTDSALIQESSLVFRTGFRLLFLPWMVVLFFVLEAFFSKHPSKTK